MKIRLISDIHQEFYEDTSLYKTQGEDLLVLLGDIHVGTHQVEKTLRKFSEQQETIIYIPGNHEYYRTTIDDFDTSIGLLTRDLGIHLLNPGMVRIGGVTFIGATLWTNFRRNAVAKLACSRSINDFQAIKGFSVDECNLLHEAHSRYIRLAYLAAAEGPKVICTHFLPAVECIAPEYQGPDLINYYFANDYGNYISTLKDTTWLFGHTHTPVDLYIGDTRLIANPYGYNRNPNYKEMILEL
jgi:predicted phosphodiesterase